MGLGVGFAAGFALAVGVGVALGVGFLHVMFAAGLYLVVKGSRLTSLPAILNTRVTTMVKPSEPT